MRIPTISLLAIGLFATANVAFAQAGTNNRSDSVVREPYPGLSFVTPPPQLSKARDRAVEQDVDRTGSVIQRRVRR